ncbi:gas vesicle protein GvpA/GvpJ/GvpM family [Pseudonocardia endophytica]|uniref:Gas vesicle protein GvpA/GvpJ/GvpM family n=1 Tax=Pseudonocardia endophytica TaxID=401976 RepID=A0A4R1HKK4_PSEEN|nr:gas vesicle protein GvpA/GvpJ/GvpM family [Pseudonocardia endophytica]
MSETARWAGPAPPQQQRAQQSNGRADGANLADILERVLDKGIVIAGDIQVNLLDIELLTIKIRLVVASVERAKEMGIDWWERDPTLSAGRRELEDENKELRARIEALERNGHRDAGSRELAPADDEPDDVVDEPYEDEDLGDVEDTDVEDTDVEDDRVDDLDESDPDDADPDDAEPDDAEPDRHDGPADDERPTGGNGRSGRAARAKADSDEGDAAEDTGGGSGRSRGGRGRARASDGADREAPVRRKPGSKRSTTRER